MSSNPFGARFQVQVPSGRSQQRLTSADTERIAIALSEILDTPLESDWLQIRKLRTAGSYEITVVLEDSMGDVVPYRDACEWTSIGVPALVGHGIDRRPVHLNLAQHGEDIGKTRSGKSSLIHVKLAHLTRCRDAVVWVCGAEKLYDFVAGWLDPYARTDWPLPFDWTATGQHDTVNMLVAAMNIARWRQRQPMSQRTGWPHIVIVLDEASFALRNQAVRGNYQGQAVTAAQMAAMISQGAGSANVWLLRATQRSTNDHSGDQGGDTSANVGYSTAFRSKDWAEIGRLMGDFGLPMPRHAGQFWLDPGTGDDPILVKAPYMQEIDPSKAHLHDGATVSDVAWSRRHFPRELDAGSARAAGQAYAERHVRMDAAMQSYLLGEPATVPRDQQADDGGDGAGGHNAGYEAVMRELAAIDAGTAESSSSENDGAVVALKGRRPRADRIADIVNEHEPMSLADIVTALHESGDSCSKQTVMNALGGLVNDGRVSRPSRDQYVSAVHTHIHKQQPRG